MNKFLLLFFFIIPLFQSCYEIGGEDYLASSSSAGVSSDPGSGSALIAAILAMLSGIYFYIKKYYYMIKNFIIKIFPFLKK